MYEQILNYQVVLTIFFAVKLRVLLITSLIPSHVRWYGNQAT